MTITLIIPHDFPDFYDKPQDLVIYHVFSLAATISLVSTLVSISFDCRRLLFRLVQPNQLRLLLLAAEEPEDGDGKLERRDEPQAVLHEARGLGDEAAGDGADEGEDEGGGALVPLRVGGEGGEDGGVADEVAEQRRDDDGRHLGDAQPAAVDDLAGRLEGEQRDGRELGEVDVRRVPPRRVPAVDEPALHDARGQRYEDGLHQERDEDGAPLAAAPDERVEPREDYAAYYEGADGRHLFYLALACFIILTEVNSWQLL